MSLLRNFHLSRAFDKLLKALQPLEDAIEKGDDVKSIFQSKTFWVNVLTAGAGVLGYLPNNKYTIPVIGVVNVLLRYITNQPVNITGQ